MIRMEGLKKAFDLCKNEKIDFNCFYVYLCEELVISSMVSDLVYFIKPNSIESMLKSSRMITLKKIFDLIKKDKINVYQFYEYLCEANMLVTTGFDSTNLDEYVNNNEEIQKKLQIIL